MKKKDMAIAAFLLAAAVGAVGCTSTLQDLEGVKATEPDAYEVFQAPDTFPNVARICVDGVAFVATTRDYQQVTRVEEWDDECGGRG